MKYRSSSLYKTTDVLNFCNTDYLLLVPKGSLDLQILLLLCSREIQLVKWPFATITRKNVQKSLKFSSRCISEARKESTLLYSVKRANKQARFDRLTRV